MTPTRIQLSRRKGFRLPLDARGVARPSLHGNPWSVQRDPIIRGRWLVVHNDRVESAHHAKAPAILAAVVAHRKWITKQLDDPWMQAQLRGMKGLSLACWCPLPEPGAPDICHATTLMTLAAAA